MFSHFYFFVARYRCVNPKKGGYIIIFDILTTFWVAFTYNILITAKKIQVSDNKTVCERVILCGGEIFGTAILLFLGCASCVNFGGKVETAPSHLQICLTFGLAVMVAIMSFGAVSGAHINPVVTLTAAILGHLPLIEVPIYFAGQMIGGLLGFGLLKAATPSHLSTSLCSPGLPRDKDGTLLIATWQGFLAEFMACLILALVCAGVWDRRNKDKHESITLRFGLTIAVLALAAGPYSGANMNPARSFAPALINGDWSEHWLYWIAPMGAAVVGSLLYRFLFSSEVQEAAAGVESVPLNDKP